MRLSHVLVSSDLNPRYLECWPLAAEAWQSIVGVEPVLVLVAAPSETPPTLRADPRVRIFEPLPRLHTAFQAQCIRLLYPALLETEGGGVLTSDVDMVPLDRHYFHRFAQRVDAHHFLAYRDVLLPSREIPLCYSAAIPRTWADIFQVSTIDDLRSRLLEWSAGLAYDGNRGGQGWNSDQIRMHDVLMARGRSHEDVWILDDRYSGFRRLNTEVLLPGLGGPHLRRRIAHGAYSDFHCIHPLAVYGEVNRAVVELAAKGRT